MSNGQAAVLLGVLLVAFLIWRANEREKAKAAAHKAAMDNANQMVGWAWTAVMTYFGA